MSREPKFRKYCETRWCSIMPKVELAQKGDGYKQVCPVCGRVYNPMEGMSFYEINQWEMSQQ